MFYGALLLHRLFRVLPGFGIANFVPDISHVKFLGSLLYLFGSVLALLTHYHMVWNKLANLKAGVASMEEAYGRERVTHKDLYPNLRISQYKGAKATVWQSSRAQECNAKGSA